MTRYRACIDVHLVLRQEDTILLGQRHNTGFADGYWHLPSGHAEDSESATAGIIREATEELGITIDPDDLQFVHIMHHYTDSGRIALFFETRAWEGQIINAEPDKCAGWNWFPLASLPSPLIPYTAAALAFYTTHQPYSEHGWQES